MSDTRYLPDAYYVVKKSQMKVILPLFYSFWNVR